MPEPLECPGFGAISAGRNETCAGQETLWS
jgi:hypothetical protein